jgi:glycosyltransferase involved in cell wall biosynthesis
LRLLFVVPRFGARVIGGAESLMRSLALQAARDGHVVEVATTCATSHETWENVLVPGETEEDGLCVRRFPVSDRDADRHAQLATRLALRGRLSYLEELDLMATSVWSSELQSFLEKDAAGYDLVLLSPYLFGTTFWGAQAWPEHSVLVPCLHDEPYAYMVCMKRLFATVAGCMFNSGAEESLARRLYNVRAGGIVGMGFSAPQSPARPGFAAAHGLSRYLVFAGRLEEGKGVHTAVEYVARYARHHAPELRLVLLGRGSYRVPREYAWATLELGYVDEETKRSALAEAVALVNPSRLESLSIVLMEAWLEGTPALVAAECDTLRAHCERSGGGIPYRGFLGFASALRELLESPEAARARGHAGRAYVLEEYGLDAVAERFRRLVRQLATVSRRRER